PRPAVVPAVYIPPAVTVPPDVLQATLTVTLSPSCVRPYARNCCVWYGSSVTLSGVTTTCTTGLLGPLTCRIRSHAARTAAAAASEALMSARRLDSLKVNGMAPTLLRKKGPPDSLAARRTSRACARLSPVALRHRLSAVLL